MSAQITNYKCPACDGALQFDSASGKLKCEYCDSSFTVEEVEALYAEKTKKAEESFEQEKETNDTEEAVNEETFENDWDTSNLTDDWGEDTASMKSYSCPSCGAELICDSTTAATSCPYCGNPSIVPGQFGGALKPDLVIPFKLDKEAAKEALKKHYNKFLLPKAFKKNNHIEEIKGIYVPFWLYDAEAEADCTFHATTSSSHRSGDYRITTTRHYTVQRSGSLAFEAVPADGSKKMPDDYMDSIEPYDYSEMKPFSTAYLPGYLADRYDVSAEDNASRADERCKGSTIDFLRNDVTGYSGVSLTGSSFRMKRGRVRYALLPVWTLVTKWKNKDYLFMMNGQTGKLVGDLPVDKKRFWLLFFIITAAIFGFLYITGLSTVLGKMLAAMSGE